MKELPKVFANPIDKKIDNNSIYSYCKLERGPKERDEAYVRSKIDKIFKNSGSLYSIDCVVKFKDTEERYTIIGKTDRNLITKNQMVIHISDIYDISLA